MATDRYVSLHRHSSFSLYDGLDVNVRAAEFAVRLEQPALALTDHGSTFGLVDHYRLTSERGVKPVMGCELYLVDSLDKDSPRRHLTVLAADQAGYRNLMRLVTRSYKQMYYKPRLTYEDLEEHADGLIVLSGCPSGHFTKAIEAGDLELAEQYFCRLLSAFKDRFFAEVQHHGSASAVGRVIYEIAAKHGVPIVATNDAHYVEAQDRQAHDALLRLRADQKSKGEDELTYGEGFHMVSREEMRRYLQSAHPWMSSMTVESALDQTVEIADMVTFRLEQPDRMLPPMWGTGDAPMQRLAALAESGMARFGLQVKPRYVERLREEMRVVSKLGYPEYFLLCADVLDWAKERGILVGPRGSVCGSLLAYVTGITMVDPLVHGTLFERFLHEEKKNYPDVDLDIDSRHQDAVLKYVFGRFSPNAYPIAAFGRWGPGNVSNDLASLYELPDELRKALRADLFDLHDEQRVFVATEQNLMGYGSFRAAEQEVPGFCRVASRLYSQVRYIGRHPGGVVFCPGPHESWFAVAQAQGEQVCASNYFDTEFCRLLKVDFLGLDAVASVAKTIEMIKARHQEEIDPAQIPLDDTRVLSRFAMGDTDGVFQFETRGAREIVRAVEPDSFIEVAAATALNRPGVSANIEGYVEGKRCRR